MSWSALDDLYRKPEEDPTWGDYAKTVGSSTAGIAAGGAGLLRHMFEAGQHPNAAGMFRELQNAARAVGDDIEGSMTPEARERLGAGVTTDKFWEHPVSSLALKATGMTPYLLGGIGPGLLARGAGAVGALTASGGASGWLAAGDVVDEITKKPDQMSLEQLRKESPLFAGFLDAGDDERQARDKLNQIMVGAKPAIAFLLGAATGVAGPVGQVVRGAAGAGRHGIVRGALEGGITEFGEEGYGGYAAQKSEIEGGLRRDYSQDEILDRALTGAVLGTGFGAVSGIGGGKGKAKANEIREAQEQRRREEGAGAQVPAGEAGVPPETEAPPTARDKVAASKKGVTVGVDPAIEAALAAEQSPMPKINPAEAAVPPTPTPPAPLNQPAPPAAQPPQAPVVPPQEPAAGVTPEVTMEMAKRGFTSEEAAQLTPEQQQQILATAPPQEKARPPTEVAPLEQVPTAPGVVPSSEPPLPSAPAEVATAPESTPLSTNRPELVQPETPAANISAEGVKSTGRVLQDISKEGKGKQKAQVVAQAAREKAALAEPVEKKVSKGKKAAHDVKAQAARDELAVKIFGEHTSSDDPASKLPVPKTKQERQALGERLKPLVAALKTKMELREDVAVPLAHVKKYYNETGEGRTSPTDDERTRWHSSLPGRVGGVVPATGEPRPVHTQYLRELVDVQNMLSSGKSLKPEQKRRVENFIVAYNGRAADLIHDSRKEGGQNYATGKRTAAQQDAADAGTIAAGATIRTPQTFGAVEGSERTLKGNEAAVAAAEALERLAKKQGQAPAPASVEKVSPVNQAKAAAARLADKYAPPAETPPAKPKGAEVVAAAREKAKPTRAEIDQEAKDLAAEYNAAHGKITEGTKPEEKVTPEVTDHISGMSEKARHAALRKWMTQAQINEISTKDQIAFLKDPPPIPTAAPKAPPRVRAKTEAELEAEELARENAERVEEIEREEAREREVREEIERENAKKEPARPTTQAATAEEVAAYAPRATSVPKVVTDKRAALKAALKAQQGKPGILRMGAMSDLEMEGMTDEQIDGMTDEELANILEDLERIGSAPQKGVSWNSEDADLWETPLHKAHAVYGHDAKVAPVTLNASDVLRQLDLSHLKSAPQYIQDFVRRRLTEVLGNVKIHIANADLITDATGDVRAPAGYFHPTETGPGYIAIQAEILNNRREFTHTVIHEALHAALYNRLNNSKTFQIRIQTLMQALDDHTQGRASRKYAEYALGITKPGQTVNYELSGMHEFVAEALSNPKLQQMMRAMRLSPQFAEALGLPPVKKQTLWGAFTEKVREVLKLPPGAHNLLHETLQVIGPELAGVRSTALSQGTFKQEARPQLLRRMSVDTLRDAAIGKTADTRVNAKGKTESYMDKVSRMWDMARRGAHLYGPSNPLYRLHELRAKMERAKATVLKKFGGEDAAAAVAQMERKYPEQMARIKDIALRASLHDVNLDGSNDHLGKDKLMGVQAKNEIAALQKEWNDKSLDPVRPAVRSAMKFFKDIHNAVSRETINNILAEANIHDKALAERIHTSGLTEADEKTWAGTKLVSALDQVASLKRRQGSFVPFRRYGDYISAAEHELSVPANATKINDNTLQFVDPTGKGGNARARAQVKTYLRSKSHTPQGNQLTPAQIRKVWVDKNNPTEIIEGTDPNAIPAYRVAMQTAHVEMHETQAAAQNSQADLADAGLLNSRTHKREEAYRTEATNIQSAMGTVLRSLEKQQRFIDADQTQKAAMREMFHDLTLGLSGTTSIKNSMRQRRNVAGMSRDLGRVTADYARMTSNHLAKLEYRPKIDAVFKEMRDYNDNHPDDKNRIRREEVYEEFVNRIYGRAATRADEHKPGVVSRVLQVTRLSFLAGPSYHLINAHEPWTTSLPVIGGDHGMVRTAKAITDAYNLIGGRAGVIAGLKDTAAAYTKDTGFTDYVKMFKDTIAKNKTVGGDRARRLTDLFDYADARNLFSNASIFEMAKLANPEGNIAGRAIDRADLMANQVGTAIEAINRSVTLIPAYELQYKKNGGNHEAAMHYAYSKANDTMGDYSAWNAAPVFNTAFGRPLLQFKKFPQKTYMLLGNIMGGVLKGDPAAMKQFAGLMVTHAMVAGALGMPTEPFKLALILANVTGVTGFTPEDYEYAVRQLAARVAGQKGGEIISKGLYRGLGIEVSGRMGFDSLLVRGAPKSTKDKDIKEFLFDTMAGASGSFLLNQVQGAQAAMKGDFATAVEKISPLRTVGDITKAVVGASGDKLGPTGKVKQEQFTAWQAAVRAAGFQPSAPVERGAMEGVVKREGMREAAERAAVIKTRLEATGHKIVAAQRAIQEFNAGRPKNQQITQKDLTNAANRRKNEEKVTEHGITISNRTRNIYDKASSVFNP